VKALYGIEARAKPFPSVVHELRYQFRDVRSILDIGAGTGRFLSYFVHGVYRSPRGVWINEAAPPLERYAAVEPYPKSCEKLKAMATPAVEVVCAPWEAVREKYLRDKYDMVVWWDSAMFMDLSVVHGGTPVEALLRELDAVVDRARRWLLFSFHDVERCVVCRRDFDAVYAYLDSRLRLVAKRGWNRVYAKA